MVKLIKFFLWQQRRIIICLMIFGSMINLFFINMYHQNDMVSRKIASDFNRNYPINNEIDNQIRINLASAIDNDDSYQYLVNKLSLDRYYYDSNFIIHTKSYHLNQIDFNQYLLEHHIETLNMVNKTYNQLSTINSVSSCYLTFSQVLVFILPIITLLVGYSIISIKPVTYHYLMTLPYKKSHIVYAKIIAAFIAGTSIVLFIIILSFIVGFYLGGSGDFNYPIVTNYLFIFKQEQSLIAFWQYLIFVVLATILNILIYTLVSLLLVSIFKNSWISLTISLIIALFPVVYFFQLDHFSYSHIIPLLFDNSHVLITYGDSYLGYGLFCLVLIMVTLFICRYRYFKR